jgi:hypothetical protein
MFISYEYPFIFSQLLASHSCDPVQISLDRTRYVRVGELYYTARTSFDRSPNPNTKIWLLIFQYI